MYLVKMLLSMLMIISFSGCCKNEIVPQKCKVPFTEEPMIDNEKCEDGNNGCVISKALRNYEAQKDYANRLKINSEVCR